MRKQLLTGAILMFFGLWLGSYRTRPYIDLDFPLVWYGLILALDSLARGRGAKSVLSNRRAFLQLAFVSAPFWWFYEWANISLRNWAYPEIMPLYSKMGWAAMATLSFTTVLPAILAVTNFTGALLGKLNPTEKEKVLPDIWIAASILAGLASLGLSLLYPTYFFALIWIVLFLILDPTNARTARPSLLVQVRAKNYALFGVIALGSLLTGFFWESLNILIPKWTYSLELSPWFWNLPAPINTKIFEMPLVGYLGYIPFGWSAFAFVQFLGINVPWLSKKS